MGIATGVAMAKLVDATNEIGKLTGGSPNRSRSALARARYAKT
jgi:hypothetical protein